MWNCFPGLSAMVCIRPLGSVSCMRSPAEKGPRRSSAPVGGVMGGQSSCGRSTLSATALSRSEVTRPRTVPAEVTTTTDDPVLAMARSTGSASSPGASSTTHSSGSRTTTEDSGVVGGRVAMSGAVGDGAGSSRVGRPRSSSATTRRPMPTSSPTGVVAGTTHHRRP